jgi:hypothetical protein
VALRVSHNNGDKTLAYMPLPVKITVHDGGGPNLSTLSDLINAPASNVHSVLHATTAGTVDGMATVDSSSQKMLLEPHVEICGGHARLLKAALIPEQRTGEEVANRVASGGVGVQAMEQLGEAAVRSCLDGEFHGTVLGTSLGIIGHPSHLLTDGQEKVGVDPGSGGLACSKASKEFQKTCIPQSSDKNPKGKVGALG